MARKQSRHPVSQTSNLQPQDLLWASLGVVSLGRKQAAQAYQDGVEGVVQLQARAGSAINRAALRFNSGVAKLAKQAKTDAAPVRRQVAVLFAQAQDEALVRLAPALDALQPLLARLGNKRPAKRRPAAKRVVRAARTRKAG